MDAQTRSITFSREIFESFWPLSGVKVGKILQQRDGKLVGEIFANEGNFVYKVANPGQREENIIGDTFAFNFLRARNFQHIPALLQTRERENYQNVDAKFVFVMERIEGSKTGETPENWAQLGEIAAEIHDISDYPYGSGFTIQSKRSEFEHTAAKLPFGKEYLEVVAGLPNFDGLSQSLIHTDVGLDNVLMKPDKSMVLVDWDGAGLGTTILDLGYPLCYFVSNEDFDFAKDRATAFYNAYFSKRTLPDRERDLIFDAGLLYYLVDCTHGDVEKKWQSLQLALKSRDLVSSAVRCCEVPPEVHGKMRDEKVALHISQF